MANNILSGSLPVCVSNISENEHRHLYLDVWCNLNYTGNGDPVFSWTKGSDAQKIAANTTIYGSDRESLTSTSSIKDQLHPCDSGVVFQCQITFRMPDKTTINEFEYTWNYTLCK